LRSEHLAYPLHDSYTSGLGEHAANLRRVHQKLEKALSDCNWSGLEDDIERAKSLYYFTQEWEIWLRSEFGPRLLSHTFHHLGDQLHVKHGEFYKYKSAAATRLAELPNSSERLGEFSTWTVLEAEFNRKLVSEKKYLANIERLYSNLRHVEDWVHNLKILWKTGGEWTMDIMDPSHSTGRDWIIIFTELQKQLSARIEDARTFEKGSVEAYAQNSLQFRN